MLGASSPRARVATCWTDEIMLCSSACEDAVNRVPPCSVNRKIHSSTRTHVWVSKLLHQTNRQKTTLFWPTKSIVALQDIYVARIHKTNQLRPPQYYCWTVTYSWLRLWYFRVKPEAGRSMLNKIPYQVRKQITNNYIESRIWWLCKTYLASYYSQ